MRLLGRRRRKTAVLLAMASGERSSVWGVGGGRRVDRKGVGGFVLAIVIPVAVRGEQSVAALLVDGVLEDSNEKAKGGDYARRCWI